MWVQVYREAGYEEAARACRLSRGNQHLSDTVSDELCSEDAKLFMKLLKADKKASGDPHSVGLRQIVFWIGISAPLYWWKHMDRYCVGKDQASSSTMHTLLNRDLTKDDFEGIIPVVTLWFLNHHIHKNNFEVVNRNLPQSYLQERSLMISLPTLRRIIAQRDCHKLREWNFFIDAVLAQVRYKELLL